MSLGTVQTLIQFTHNPRRSHLNVAFRVLRYLKLNHGKGVNVVKSNDLDLCTFVDADWQNLFLVGEVLPVSVFTLVGL